MRTNFILDTDSYKTSHYLQYPPGMTRMYSYLESRGGVYDRTVFFGLQYLLKEYLSKPIELADVLEAEDFCARHGVPFPRAAWEKVLNKHRGFIPMEIKAVREGSVVPVSNVLMTAVSTTDDPELAFLVGWFETMLMRLWYPTTVATQSWFCKRTILQHLIRTADDPWAEIDFKLHDFGSRGVSSRESAGIGGMSHLVNFRGSDTIEGVRFANYYYGCDMSAFSIPAAEHSTITAWGRDREHEAYANMVKQFCKPGSLVACVSDSYDLYNVVENIWAGSLREEIEKSGATLVIRPDSGDPVEVNLTLLGMLKHKVGMTANSKGYLVLPKHFRLIQGDGVNQKSIDALLTAMEQHGYSASNIAFGMGGALLQQVNRDTQKFAYKCSAVEVDGKWCDVYKDPVTDHGKRSKAGRLDLILNERDDYQTIQYTPVTEHLSELQTVYNCGQVQSDSFADIRLRANAALQKEFV